MFSVGRIRRGFPAALIFTRWLHIVGDEMWLAQSSMIGVLGVPCARIQKDSDNVVLFELGDEMISVDSAPFSW